ncbi:hypothetical protein K523DRAFT_144428 [Schizophyllum commune Tattone D]|nr:hypothetical protein K523DRAFT_144428 [Schizophyllum commune Tattone D]
MCAARTRARRRRRCYGDNDVARLLAAASARAARRRPLARSSHTWLRAVCRERKGSGIGSGRADRSRAASACRSEWTGERSAVRRVGLRAGNGRVRSARRPARAHAGWAGSSPMARFSAFAESATRANARAIASVGYGGAASDAWERAERAQGWRGARRRGGRGVGRVGWRAARGCASGSGRRRDDDDERIADGGGGVSATSTTAMACSAMSGRPCRVAVFVGICCNGRCNKSL